MSQSNSKSFNTAGVSSANRDSNITCNNYDTDYSYSAEMLIGRTVQVPTGQPLNQVLETILRNLTHKTSSRGTSSDTSDDSNEDPAISPTRMDHGHHVLQEHLLTDQDPTVDEEKKDDDGDQEVNHDQEAGSSQQQQRWTALVTEVHSCMIFEDIMEELFMEELGNTGKRRRVDQDPTMSSQPPRQ